MLIWIILYILLMEYLFDELKQFDLKKINPCDMKIKHYYIGMKNNSIIYFYFMNNDCKLKLHYFNEFYEFVNKTFDELTIITETFFNFCHTLKNTKQRIIDLNNKKYNAINLKFICNTDKTGHSTNIIISLEYKEIINLSYSSYKITKYQNNAKFNKAFMKFIKKSRCSDVICYYY